MRTKSLEVNTTLVGFFPIFFQCKTREDKGNLLKCFILFHSVLHKITQSTTNVPIQQLFLSLNQIIDLINMMRILSQWSMEITLVFGSFQFKTLFWCTKDPVPSLNFFGTVRLGTSIKSSNALSFSELIL